MYWLTQSIYSFKVIPFLGGWLADRLLGDPEGWSHPMEVSRPTMRPTCVRPSSTLRSTASKTAFTSVINVFPARQ